MSCPSPVLASEILRLGTSPLSGDPLAYVGRAVSEFDSIGFAVGKKHYSLSIHQENLLEVEGDAALLPSDQFSQRIDVLSVNPAAHAQHSKVFSNYNPFDSATHCAALDLEPCLSSLRARSRNSGLTANSRTANHNPFVTT